ncbi:hypothetical protein GUJ93_ZPchr0002g25695 [Zizania palustris]|uniref:Uncharacterized protein n=1 Tax=Zizania palustris TaxID=103762 RepID=A0A8J5RCX3_ZIZPA|nr:hypothetical protein GUJ93_ZPchr0002g25695 [Zizania palustris]
MFTNQELLILQCSSTPRILDAPHDKVIHWPWNNNAVLHCYSSTVELVMSIILCVWEVARCPRSSPEDTVLLPLRTPLQLYKICDRQREQIV